MSMDENTEGQASRRWVTMGVSGSGKSVVGRLLAQRLDCRFIEGDDFHPQANLDKMAKGIALNDDDRREWLMRVRDAILQATALGETIVISCSALKRRYRDLLREGDPDLICVHLHGERRLIAQRMQARTKHFMPLSLLDSQFADLEPLGADETGIVLNVRETPDALADAAFNWQFTGAGRAAPLSRERR